MKKFIITFLIFLINLSAYLCAENEPYFPDDYSKYTISLDPDYWYVNKHHSHRPVNYQPIKFTIGKSYYMKGTVHAKMYPDIDLDLSREYFAKGLWHPILHFAHFERNYDTSKLDIQSHCNIFFRNCAPKRNWGCIKQVGNTLKGPIIEGLGSSIMAKPAHFRLYIINDEVRSNENETLYNTYYFIIFNQFHWSNGTRAIADSIFESIKNIYE